MALKKFQKYLEGQLFYMLRDHKLWTQALNICLECDSSHEAMHLDYISWFTSKIHFGYGPDNEVADTHSRIETNTFLVG